MAKRQTNPSTGVPFRTMSQDDAQRLLAESRSGRGGRVSKYHGILEAARTLGQGKALHATLSRAEVQGLRQYLSKQLGDKVKVSSSAVKGEDGQFHVVVMNTEA